MPSSFWEFPKHIDWHPTLNGSRWSKKLWSQLSKILDPWKQMPTTRSIGMYGTCLVFLILTILIWRFPGIGGPPHHPNLMGFSIVNHPFLGTPILGNLHILRMLENQTSSPDFTIGTSTKLELRTSKSPVNWSSAWPSSYVMCAELWWKVMWKWTTKSQSPKDQLCLYMPLNGYGLDIRLITG